MFGWWMGMCVGFAAVYGVLDHAAGRRHFGFQNAVVDPLYFSTTTSATVGYGDVVPRSRTAKALVMLHHLCLAGLVAALGCMLLASRRHRPPASS